MGYSILYKEYIILLGSTTKKDTTHKEQGDLPSPSATPAPGSGDARRFGISILCVGLAHRVLVEGRMYSLRDIGVNIFAVEEFRFQGVGFETLGVESRQCPATLAAGLH